MPGLRALFMVVGMAMLAMGLLWVGQGTGLVMWPSSSFMLAERQWALNGGFLAAAGLVLLWIGRRRS